MRTVSAIALVVAVIVLAFFYFRKPQPQHIEYTLVSDMVLEALLETSEKSNTGDSSVVKQVSYRNVSLDHVAFLPPEDRGRVGDMIDRRRHETNDLAGAGIVGTCCCPCETNDGTKESIKGDLCPCPEFTELRFLAPTKSQTEMLLDNTATYAKEPLNGTDNKWEVFRLPENTSLVDGDYTLVIRGVYFDTQVREEFRINIRIQDGKAFLR